MRMTSIFCSVFTIVLLVQAGGVLAAEVPGEPVLHQQFDLGGRFEVNLTALNLSTFDKYTRHLGSSLGVAYFFNDTIGLEAEGGYAFLSGDRKLLDEILTTAADTSISGINYLPLTDLKHMTWWAHGGFILNPLYGKLNFSAELSVSFHLFLVGGGGVAEYHYSMLNHGIPDPKFGGRFGKVDVNAGVKPTFYFGGGLRFHVSQLLSLRLEMRDVVYYDGKYEADYKPSGVDVVTKVIKDFVHTTLLRLTVCFTF